MTTKSLLTLPADLEAPKSIAGMLYGQPGARKTTTAISAPNPVLLDFDRGLHRVKPEYRVPSLQVENYQQVLDLLEGDELAPFDTLVVDTGGKLIDSIIAYVIKKNPKDGNGRGAPSQQGWGTVKSEFQVFVKRVKASGKSVIFVAHESEEKNGEDTIKRPDIAGSARKDVVKELDFMGYMELRNDKPVINFNPTDKFYAKNSMELDAAVEVPNLTPGKPNDFLARYVFKASETKLASDALLRREYDALLIENEAMIAGLKTLEEVNAFYVDTLPALRVIWGSQFYAKAALKERVDALGFSFDKEARLFVAKEPAAKTKAAKTAKAQPAAEAPGTEEPAQGATASEEAAAVSGATPISDAGFSE